MFYPDWSQIGVKEPTKIARMNTGSSSVNYYIKNEDGEFLVKCVKNTDKEAIHRLSDNLRQVRKKKFCPCICFEKKLKDEHIFVLEWVDGDSYFLESLSPETFDGVIAAYRSFLKTVNAHPKQRDMLPPQRLIDLYRNIKKPYFFIRQELAAIKKILDYQPTLWVIHGDFHFKNIVFRNNRLQSFLDFENLRPGCPTEDLIRLILTNAEQHSFRREGYTLRLLKTLMAKTHFSKADWLYGWAVFVLVKYNKKLKRRTLFNRIALYRCNHLYRKVYREIDAYFSKNSP